MHYLFPAIVINSINGILKPLVVGTNHILKDQLLDMKELQKKKDRLEWEEAVRRKTYGVIDPNEDYDAELRALGLDVPTQSVMDALYEVTHIFSTKYWVLQLFRWLLEILFGAAALVIDTLRIILSGDPYDSGADCFCNQHLRRVSIDLDLLVFALYLGLSLVAYRRPVQRHACEDSGFVAGSGHRIDRDHSFLPDSANSVYLIFLLISIIGYFTIPTVASWIVQSAGTGAYNKKVTGVFGGATNVAAGAAGAATGNVSGGLMK